MVCIEMKLMVGVGIPSKSFSSLPVLIFKIRHPATSRVLGLSFNREVVINNNLFTFSAALPVRQHLPARCSQFRWYSEYQLECD